MADQTNLMLGWREWVSLPDLNIPLIKAKVDTGAKTSALHAFEVEEFVGQDGVAMAAFKLHPIQKRADIIRECVAPIIDRRTVTDSGGHKEDRLVISTTIRIGEMPVMTDITLTSRENMLFRMLLGRRALVEANALVNAQASYLQGRYRKADWSAVYN